MVIKVASEQMGLSLMCVALCTLSDLLYDLNRDLYIQDWMR